MIKPNRELQVLRFLQTGSFVLRAIAARIMMPRQALSPLKPPLARWRDLGVVAKLLGEVDLVKSLSQGFSDVPWL